MKILFQGDSITDAGRSRTAAEANRGLGDGYVNLIAAELTGKAPGRYEIFNRGVGGNHRRAVRPVGGGRGAPDVRPAERAVRDQRRGV